MSHVPGFDPKIQMLHFVPKKWTHAQMQECRALQTTEGESWLMQKSEVEHTSEEEEELKICGWYRLLEVTTPTVSPIYPLPQTKLLSSADQPPPPNLLEKCEAKLRC